MHQYNDEEPDVDEMEYDYWSESLLMIGFCERCGQNGHSGKECPFVTPDLLYKKD